MGNSPPAADRDCLDSQTLSGLARAWREGIGRSVQGALSDAQIYARDWQIPLGEVTVPVDLWYGSEDSLIPLHALAPLEAVPGLRLHIVPNEGHYSLAIRHAASILGRLIEGRQHDAERDGEGSPHHNPGEHFDSPLGNQAASPSKVWTRS